MADQRMARLGSDELERGLPIDAMIGVMKTMEAAGMTSKALFDAQAVLVVEGGTGLAADSRGTRFIEVDGGIAVFMEPGSVASIERSAAKTLHAYAKLSGSLSWTVGGRCPYGDHAVRNDEAEIHPLASAWLASGERGRSSEALCRLFFGCPMASGGSDGDSHPLDPSDLRRCVLFLEATGTADRIGEAAALSPEWASLVENWQRLSGLLARESVGTSAPGTYAAMSELLRPAAKPKAGL